MIVVRTPLRISIGGGGTDLPFYYSKFKGSFISAAIDKYIYIIVKDRKFHDEVLVKYSEVEETTDIESIKHTRIREALRHMGIKRGIEIVSMSDIPAQTGLGGSSSFMVALLHALHAYKKEQISKQKLAEEACHLEINALQEPIGKQDQYVASYGGINHYSINKNGSVLANPLNLTEKDISTLESNLFLFYTGIRRSASKVLESQKEVASKNPSIGIEGLHNIKKIGEDIKKALEVGNFRRLGEWMNIHWQTKKKLSEKMTDPEIDKWYELALANGALGGKIIGAGGGGFFLFYCDNKQNNFVKTMSDSGLKRFPFKFDREGSQILFRH